MAREYEIRRVREPWTSAHQNFDVVERRLNLATAVRVNLFALPGPLEYPIGLASSAMFLWALRGKWSGRLRVAEHMLRAPDFQRKPVAEMLGLAITIEVAGEYEWDGQGPQSIDTLRQYWGTTSQRPDLLFTVRNSRLQFVGEAKGRLLAAIRPSAPHSDERQWLTDLSDWYGDIGLKYFLLVAMGTPTHVVANLYDPGEPQVVYPSAMLDAAIGSRVETLLETAPPADVEVAGQAIRGRWTPVINDSIDDENEDSWLFIGLMEGPGVPTPVESEGDDWQLSARGRVVVLLRRAGEGTLAAPPMSDVASYFPQRDFTIRRGGRAIATGAPLPDGRFRVYAGSVSRPPGLSVLESDRSRREELLRLQVLEVVMFSNTKDRIFLFGEDWDFASASAAARLVLGVSANGLSEWRLPDGTPLREAST
jgi:hypothetical protein